MFSLAGWNEESRFKDFDFMLPHVCIGWLVGFLTSSSTTRLYRGRAPRQSVWQFYVLAHMRQSWETMASVSAGHIILTPDPTSREAGGHSGNRTRDLLTRSRALYRLSYCMSALGMPLFELNRNSSFFLLKGNFPAFFFPSQIFSVCATI